MQDQQPDWISLHSTELGAAVDPFGSQLSALRDSSGRELLWHGDPAVWAGRAPILFPIVGTLAGGRYRVGEKTYSLPRHGFARVKPFEVVLATLSRATFRLTADQSTLQVYPFHFQLDVTFALEGATLSVVSTVRNLGKEPMPASVGYHPGFRWPLPFGQPREAHYLEFANDEGPAIRRLDSAGLLTAERHPTPVVGRKLALDDSLFRDDVVILDGIRSRSVTYGAPTGPRIQVSYPDAEFLGIWTKPGAELLCIEPWLGIADEAGFAGDFSQKLGVFTLAPGASKALTMRITLLS